MSEDLRYPVGRFHLVERLTSEERAAALEVLEEAPGMLRRAVEGLDESQLDTPYREGGWTVRQVVHHIPDSHLNAYIRVRWTLTEDFPTIKAYDQARWAELPDARTAPIELSLRLLEAVHGRLTRLLRSLDEEQFHRRLDHPDGWNGTVDTLVAMYAWHTRHHVAHVTRLRERMGW